MRKWKWPILTLLALLALGGGGVFLYTQQRSAGAAAEAAASPAMQTAIARRGELEVLADGTGQVIAAAEIALGFSESGTLLELNVALGQKVQPGQVLARLQTNHTPEEIAAAISEAELAVLTKQKALDELVQNAALARAQAMNEIITYAAAVRDARYQLENYTVPTILQGMTAIEAVDRMKAELDAALAAFEPYRYYPAGDETRQALLLALNTAQANYAAAIKRLTYEYALEVAQANLDAARQTYEKYKDGPAADELAIAQAELANAQAKLALAKQTQAVLELTAPVGGTVMAITANVGEAVGASPFITLADLDHPQLAVYIDETDLDKVAVGYPAEVIFDAYPDLTFAGQVISVNPALQSAGNVQAIQVIVQLTGDSPAVSLPIGLSASVTIIAGRAENAVLVPVEALRELGPNEYGVFVIENGQPVLRVVQVGLRDLTSAVILSGVQAGETVSTGIVQSAGQ